MGHQGTDAHYFAPKTSLFLTGGKKLLPIQSQHHQAHQMFLMVGSRNCVTRPTHHHLVVAGIRPPPLKLMSMFVARYTSSKTASLAKAWTLKLMPPSPPCAPNTPNHLHLPSHHLPHHLPTSSPPNRQPWHSPPSHRHSKWAICHEGCLLQRCDVDAST
jgi:hypothetical protein